MWPIWQRGDMIEPAMHPLEAYRRRTEPPKSKALLAREIGVNRATVGRWERGERTPDRKFLPTIAKLTGASISELIGLPADEQGAAG